MATSTEVLRGERKVQLAVAPAATRRSRSGAADAAKAESPAEHALFERLRKLRKRLADHSGVPPYVIFHDYTLREMARQAPTSIAEFASIPGVGQAKLARYGQMFTDEIRAGLENDQ